MAFPFVILCLIAMPMHHSWQASAKAVAISMLTLNPFHSLYMLVPAGVAVGLGYFYRGRQDISSGAVAESRNPVR